MRRGSGINKGTDPERQQNEFKRGGRVGACESRRFRGRMCTTKLSRGGVQVASRAGSKRFGDRGSRGV